MEENIFYIGGYLSDEEIQYCINHSIPFDMAANNFQRKLIKGFSEEVTYINIPFIRYSKSSKRNKATVFRGSIKLSESSFLNYKYINNFFKYLAIKKAIRNIDFSDSIIFCYAIHTPFLRIIKIIKKKYKRVRVIQIIPDLPQFMNVNSKSTKLYAFLKKIDLYKIEKLLNYIDLFVPFTKTMYDDFLYKYSKRYYVMEGISEFNFKRETIKTNSKQFNVVYAGSLNKKYGVEKLVNSFQYLNNKNIVLQICGTGELQDYLEKNTFDNVKYLGLLNKYEVNELIQNADLLVNPREANEVFTRYSFPSKLFEYMSTGNKILCFKLPGIPDEYDQFLYYFDGNSEIDIANSIVKILNCKENKNMSKEFLNNKTSKCHINNILKEINDISIQ